MGPLGRWLAIAAVIGLLTMLAVILYLVLEPSHRDDEDGARRAPTVLALERSAGPLGTARR